MPHPHDISAPEALRILSRNEGSPKCLDVRSSGEFAHGSLPLSVNVPILTDLERHEVGLCFKTSGQAAAVSLGHQLVSPHRDLRVRQWRESLGETEWPLLTCWRGGMRSKIAADWISESGGRAIRIEGGYKALRKELLGVLDHLPEFLILSGATGSGKTRFLQQCRLPALDLEKLAHHRGSAFGGVLARPQPAQATFENYVAFELLRSPSRRLLIEDESVMIGLVRLPLELKNKMNESLVVNFRVDVEQRVNNILEEYVVDQLQQGCAPTTLLAHYRHCIRRIERKLGGAMAKTIVSHLEEAFAREDRELHRDWIRDLLVHYYDRAYAHSFLRMNRKIAFEGDWNECQSWIQNQFA